MVDIGAVPGRRPDQVHVLPISALHPLPDDVVTLIRAGRCRLGAEWIGDFGIIERAMA